MAENQPLAATSSYSCSRNYSVNCRGEAEVPSQATSSHLLPSTGKVSHWSHYKFDQVTFHKKAEFHHKTNFLQNNTHFCKSFLLENRLRDRVWYCWSFLFFMFQNSLVIILYFAMLFSTTAIFKTLEFSLLWNVEKHRLNSSQNDSNLHQNRIILSSEWRRICLPSKVTLTI